MSIKTKKILRFIPIANFAILFMWVISTMTNMSSFKSFFKVLLKIMGVMLLLTILRIAISRLNPPDIINNITFVVVTYLQILLPCNIIISDEEKVIK